MIRANRLFVEVVNDHVASFCMLSYTVGGWEVWTMFPGQNVGHNSNRIAVALPFRYRSVSIALSALLTCTSEPNSGICSTIRSSTRCAAFGNRRPSRTSTHDCAAPNRGCASGATQKAGSALSMSVAAYVRGR